MIKICLLLNYCYYVYDKEILQGVYRAIIKHKNVHLTVIMGRAMRNPYSDFDYYNNVLSVFNEESFDGLIISSTLGSYLNEQEMREFLSGLPSISKILIGSENNEIPYFKIDNKKSVKNLVNHLIEDHRCKELAFIKGPESCNDARERFETFRETLQALEVPFRENNIFAGPLVMNTGIDAMRAFLDERKSSFDAVICSNDYQAFGVLEELKRRGISVPDEVVVTGFDDIQEANSLNYNVTTVRQDIPEMSFQACQSMLESIKKETNLKPKIQLCEMVYRHSCGCSRNLSGLEVQTDRISIEIMEENFPDFQIADQLRGFQKQLDTVTLNCLKNFLSMTLPSFGIEFFEIKLQKLNKPEEYYCLIKQNMDTYDLTVMEQFYFPIACNGQYFGYVKIEQCRINNNQKKMMQIYEEVMIILSKRLAESYLELFRFHQLNSNEEKINRILVQLQGNASLKQTLLSPDADIFYVAKKLKVTKNFLSFVLNKHLNKSFREFINEYKVNEAIKLLERNDVLNLTILDIALRSGFDSKSTFNRVFKQMTSMTPTQFILVHKEEIRKKSG